MKTATTRAELHELLAAPRRAGRTIGLVPTMGYLHEGHVSLLEAARAECELVVMSCFVNPAQFRPGEDFERYPRDAERDGRLASEAGVDILYAPTVAEVYPPGFATTVAVSGLTDVLCGAPERRGAEHFRGVTTIVAKLLIAIRPAVAYFGQKDAQQAIVIERMVRDLELPARIEVLPTVREPDGLAMSSRNTLLDPAERRRAPAIYGALRAAGAAAERGDGIAAALAAARGELAAAGIEPEYLEARDAESLAPAESFDGRPVLIALAARIGGTRLIDNVIVPAGGARSSNGAADGRGVDRTEEVGELHAT